MRPIDELTDQELIEAVAIEVMGWEKANLMQESDPLYDVWEKNEVIQVTVEKWNPINDANHWMMVVEKMAESNRPFKLTLTNNLCGLWIAEFSALYPQSKVIEINKNAGRAVCRVALVAKRSMGEE